MKTKLFKLGTIVFLLSTFSITKVYCNGNWKNNVVIYLQDSLYKFKVLVTDSMVVFYNDTNKNYNDTIESSKETGKIRKIVHDSLTTKGKKPIDQLERTLTDMLTKEISLREERLKSKTDLIKTEKRIALLEEDKGENIVNLSLKNSLVNAMVFKRTKNKSNIPNDKKIRVYIESLNIHRKWNN